MTTADQIVDEIVENIISGTQGMQLQAMEKIVVVVNNLGSTTSLELHVVARRVRRVLSEGYQVTVLRMLVGNYMTALDMTGVSITLFRLHEDATLELSYLDSPVDAPGWPLLIAPTPASSSSKFITIDTPTTQVVCTVPYPATLSPSQERIFHAISCATQAIIDAEPELTKWDTAVGDGDCGFTLKAGALAIQTILKDHSLPVHELTHICPTIARILRTTIGGTSGVLYDLFFTAMGTHLSASLTVSTVSSWLQALKEGIRVIQKYGGAKEGCRTMLDALLPMHRAGMVALELNSQDFHFVLSAMAQAAHDGATKTCSIHTSEAMGRSGYVGNAAADGVPDPGAMGVAIWMTGLVEGSK